MFYCTAAITKDVVVPVYMPLERKTLAVLIYNM